MPPNDMTKTIKEFDNRLTGNRYEELKLIREQERLDAIRGGLIDDPDNKRPLSEARTFVGTCQDMCPLFEREQREYQNDVNRFEVDPETGRISSRYAVKAFHRSAAGNEQSLPSDIRPPVVLARTLDYLIDEIVCGSIPLEETHGFVRDRTRSIRTDLTVQNCRTLEAIEITERIARFHIISLHLLSEVEGFSQQQELEQLRKALQSLTEYYDDRRQHGFPAPNESEFRAYNLLLRLRDPDVLRQAEVLPDKVLDSPPVQRALKLYSLCQRSNEEVGRFKTPNAHGSLNLSRRFFKEVRSAGTSYLMACLCESYFSDIRKGALKSMRKAYQKHSIQLEELQHLLLYDTLDQALADCRHYGLPLEETPGRNPQLLLNKRSNFDESASSIGQSMTMLVEAKRGLLSLADIVRGLSLPRTAERGSKGINFLDTDMLTIVPTPSEAVGANAAEIASSNSQLHLRTSSRTQASLETSLQQEPSKQPIASLEAQFHYNGVQATDTGQINVVDGTKSSNEVRAAALQAIALQTVEQVMRDQFGKLIHDAVLARRHQREQLAAALNRLVDQAVDVVLRQGLANQVREALARRFHRQTLLRRCFRYITHALDTIRRQAIEEQARLEDENRLEEQYRDVLRTLTVDEDSTSRPPKRQRVSISSVLPTSARLVEHAEQMRSALWQPLQFSHFDLPPLNLLQGTPVIRLDADANSPPAVLEWLYCKFGLLEEKKTTLKCIGDTEVQIAERRYFTEDSPTRDVLGLVWLIIGSTQQALLPKAADLLSAIKEIASISTRKFPVLVVALSSMTQAEVSEAIKRDEMVQDINSPISAMIVLVVESPDDAIGLNQAFQQMLNFCTDSVNPQAHARVLMRERLKRRKLERERLTQAQARAHKRPLRNSFFATGVVSPRSLAQCQGIQSGQTSPLRPDEGQSSLISSNIWRFQQNLPSSTAALGLSSMKQFTYSRPAELHMSFGVARVWQDDTSSNQQDKSTSTSHRLLLEQLEHAHELLSRRVPDSVS
ncbi:actin cytoskeleton and mitosis protein [Savitreella phatthalungensis]